MAAKCGGKAQLVGIEYQSVGTKCKVFGVTVWVSLSSLSYGLPGAFSALLLSQKGRCKVTKANTAL